MAIDLITTITTIIYLYIALYIVLLLHELGHIPKQIKFGIVPYAAMNAKSRLGGLIVNVLLFVGVSIIKPEMIILQYIGLLAWIHFIYYAIAGSLLPESKFIGPNTIQDDVDNKLGFIFIPGAIISILLWQAYYLPILFQVLK